MPNPDSTSATSATENSPDQSAMEPEKAQEQLDTVLAKPKPPPFTAVWQAVLAIMVMLALEFSLGLTMSILRYFTQHLWNGWYNFSIIAIMITVPVSLAVAILLLSKRPISSLWNRGGFQVSLLPPILLLIFGVSILNSEMDNITRYFFPMPDLIEHILKNVNPDPLTGMLLMVFVAPFGEEIFFRGTLLAGFLQRYSTKTALLVSALLFALAHANPYQFISAFVAGIVLGAIYIKTKSLWPCVFAHAANNLLAWMTMNQLMPFAIPGYSTLPNDGLAFQPWWFDIMGVALTMLAVFALSKMFRNPQTPTPSNNTTSIRAY